MSQEFNIFSSYKRRRAAPSQRQFGPEVCLMSITMMWPSSLAWNNERRHYLRLVAAIDIPIDILVNDALVPFQVGFTSSSGWVIAAPGIAMRVGNQEFHALCLYCPHELCLVKAQSEVRHEFKNPYHGSRFDGSKGGALIQGPAPGGLHRFRADIARNVRRVGGIEAGMAQDPRLN